MMLADRPIATEPTVGRSGGPMARLLTLDSTHRRKPRDCPTARQPVLIVASRLGAARSPPTPPRVGTRGGMMKGTTLARLLRMAHHPCAWLRVRQGNGGSCLDQRSGMTPPRAQHMYPFVELFLNPKPEVNGSVLMDREMAVMLLGVSMKLLSST